MKKLTLISIASFLIAGTVCAQTTSVSPNTDEKKLQVESAKQKIIEVKQNAEEAIRNARELASTTHTSSVGKIGKRAEIKTAVKELVEQKIETKIDQAKENALRDFDITVRNLDNLNSRINSRINKFEASGTLDMTEPRSLLLIASTSIETVKIAIEDFRGINFSTSSDILGQDSTLSTEKSLTQPIKDKVKKIKDLIKDAHSALVDVINSITKGQNEEATTTTE